MMTPRLRARPSRAVVLNAFVSAIPSESRHACHSHRFDPRRYIYLITNRRNRDLPNVTILAAQWYEDCSQPARFAVAG
jgi:hypothetical protein